MRFPSPQGGSETCPECLARHKVVEFPSPQGGSETQLLPDSKHQASYVSIPSRRVGDNWQICGQNGAIWFPSPQGGSETQGSGKFSRRHSAFPSPQGGSETDVYPDTPENRAVVSIPSRRVGDVVVNLTLQSISKFPSPQGGSETSCRYSSPPNLRNVSIPSRRVGDLLLPLRHQRWSGCFHPLKAGRRPRNFRACGVTEGEFPSPQGGSETNAGRAKPSPQ